MGIHRGPNTVKDSLVFGYDTGYGVANNNTATRFYPGEPTVNLLNYDTTMPTWPSSSSNMAILTSKTSARSFTVIGTCNVPGAMTFVYPSITANATYHTISATFTNNSTETSNVALYIRGANNATSTVNQSQTTTMQPGQSIRKTLIGNVLTVNGGYTAAVGVWSHGTSGQVNMNVTDIQFEETTHATPFVDGTRSSTQSLIDLKRTTDIDVSNVSFDSIGQPESDGTDDYISIPGSSKSAFGQNGSLEVIVKPTNSTGNNRLWCTVNNSSSIDAYLNGSTYNVYMHGGVVGTTTSLTQNKHNHVVATYTNGTVQIYINGAAGVMTGTTTGYNITNSSSALKIGAFSNGGYNLHGRIPTFKLYSKGLTAEEVKQNFNAYKNRFNI
jgi:hypothetical protein